MFSFSPKAFSHLLFFFMKSLRPVWKIFYKETELQKDYGSKEMKFRS